MIQWLTDFIQSAFKFFTAIPLLSTVIIPSMTPSVSPVIHAASESAVPSIIIQNNESQISVTVETGGQKQERVVTNSDGTTVTQSITTGNAKASATQIIHSDGNGNTITVEAESGGNTQ